MTLSEQFTLYSIVEEGGKREDCEFFALFFPWLLVLTGGRTSGTESGTESIRHN
jgi:hypothetical protein